MLRIKATLWMIAAFAVLSCTILLAWFLLSPNGALAQVPAPPPPPDTPTHTPEPSDTPVPTDTRTPRETPIPTDSPTPTKSVKPIDTSTPTSNPTSVQTPTRPTKTQEPASRSESNPDCQSVVQGYVFGASGQPAGGATVLIEAEGSSSRIMTDEDGRYGFGGLCAGTATLGAYLSDGLAAQGAEVDLNGREGIHLDLHVAADATAPATSAPLIQQSPTPEPDMPTTGHSGWLLAGAALLGGLLLVSAGARRLLGIGERVKDPD